MKYETAEEVAESERKFEEHLAAKKKKEDEERNKPKPKQALTLPAGAQDIEAKAGELEFNVPGGKGKATIDAIAKALESAGWKAGESDGDANGGALSSSLIPRSSPPRSRSRRAAWIGAIDQKIECQPGSPLFGHIG